MKSGLSEKHQSCVKLKMCFLNSILHEILYRFRKKCKGVKIYIRKRPLQGGGVKVSDSLHIYRFLYTFHIRKKTRAFTETTIYTRD